MRFGSTTKLTFHIFSGADPSGPMPTGVSLSPASDGKARYPIEDRWRCQVNRWAGCITSDGGVMLWLRPGDAPAIGREAGRCDPRSARGAARGRNAGVAEVVADYGLVSVGLQQRGGATVTENVV